MSESAGADLRACRGAARGQNPSRWGRLTLCWGRSRVDVGLQHSLALLTADGGSSASSAREWEKNWLDQAVAALNFRTPRHAAQGGAVDAFRVEALPRRREYQAVRSRRAVRGVSTLLGCEPG